MVTRQEVHNVLRHWADYTWQVQGFGMVRTYLEGPNEPRLQVWDQRVAAWDNNAMHDHPWKFTSTIFAGMLFNQRFVEMHEDEFPVPGADKYHTTLITPGERGGQLTEAPIKDVFLYKPPVEVYGMGDTYSQEHRELHVTRYLQGTVTLIERTDREDADKAVVAWPHGTSQPPFVNPRPASDHEVAMVIGDCLKAWWL